MAASNSGIDIESWLHSFNPEEFEDMLFNRRLFAAKIINDSDDSSSCDNSAVSTTALVDPDETQWRIRSIKQLDTVDENATTSEQLPPPPTTTITSSDVTPMKPIVVNENLLTKAPKKPNQKRVIRPKPHVIAALISKTAAPRHTPMASKPSISIDEVVKQRRQQQQQQQAATSSTTEPPKTAMKKKKKKQCSKTKFNAQGEEDLNYTDLLESYDLLTDADIEEMFIFTFGREPKHKTRQFMVSALVHYEWHNRDAKRSRK